MLEGLEYEKFVYKLNAAKEAYKKSRRFIDFKGFLKSYKFSEEGSSFYVIGDEYRSFVKEYTDALDVHKNDAKVIAILKEAQESEDLRKGSGFKLSPAQIKAKKFFEEVNNKKSCLQLSEETIKSIKEYVEETDAYSFNSIGAADFYRLLSDEGKWFFALTFMEEHLDSMVMSPYINTNYDPELPIIKSKFKAASRIYLLNTMGCVRKPRLDKRTEEIKAKMKKIMQVDNSRLGQYTMEFFAESATYRKHMHTALGIEDSWWRDAVEKLYREDEATYLVIAQLLSENKKVGIARKSKAVKKFLELLDFETGKVCPYKVALEIPDTTAGEIFSFVQENKESFAEKEYDAVTTHFNRHLVQYVSIDDSFGLEIISFLKINIMPVSYGCYEYVETYFKEFGCFPEGRSSGQLLEIKERISNIQVEIRTVQDAYSDKVLSHFERIYRGEEFEN